MSADLATRAGEALQALATDPALAPLFQPSPERLERANRCADLYRRLVAEVERALLPEPGADQVGDQELCDFLDRLRDELVDPESARWWRDDDGSMVDLRASWCRGVGAALANGSQDGEAGQRRLLALVRGRQ